MATVAAALVLTAPWLSSAVLLGLGPLLLQDGSRGPWVSLVLVGGSLLVVWWLGPPWSRRPGRAPLALADVIAARWPLTGRTLTPLTLATAGTVTLFVWAQFAAWAELARAQHWPGQLVVAAVGAALGVALWRDALSRWLAVLASGLALVGLAVPLLAVMARTDPWWPRVWSTAASRPQLVFAPGSLWTTRGRAVRGTDAEATLSFRDEQRVAVVGRGPLRIQSWEGGDLRRDAATGTELSLRSGDRLVIPDGLALRFPAGRRIPGAPAAGPDWLDPPGRRADWRAFAGLGVTLLAGALGLPAAHAALPGPPASVRAAACGGAALVALALALVMFWALYAGWLTPEIYMAGVAGHEIYALPDAVAGLGESGPPLRLLALGGIAAGGFAAALLALRGAPRIAPAAKGEPWVRAGLMALGGSLAVLSSATSWSVVLGAFGLAAASVAPAAVLACWAERVTPGRLAWGAGVGLALFAGLSAARLGGPLVLDRAADSWVGWLVSWPALVAVPANALVASVGRRTPRTSPRRPLPAGLAALHD